MLSSRHGVLVTLVSSPAQDLTHTKPLKIPLEIGKRTLKTPSFPEKPLAVGDFRRRDGQLSLRVCHW